MTVRGFSRKKLIFEETIYCDEVDSPLKRTRNAYEIIPRPSIELEFLDAPKPEWFFRIGEDTGGQFIPIESPSHKLQ